MKIKNTIVTTMFACLLLPALSATAETKFPDTLTMADAISNTISQISKSDYKDLEVSTTSGNVTGEFVKKAGNVLILKRNTGSINLKHNKEKIHYILIDVNSITGISFYAID